MNPAQFPTLGDKAVVGFITQDLENAAAASWTSQVANVFPSNTASELYSGLGNVPMLREWIGAKNAKQLKEYPFRIDNKDWESTLEIKRKDLMRDKTGFVRMRTAQLGQRAAEHDAKLLSALIDAGDASTNGTAYDGANFFSDTHSVGSSGTIDNNISYDSVSTTVPTSAEFSAAIMQSIQTLYTFKDDQGEPTNQGQRNFVIMVPTTFWSAAITAVTKDRLSANTDNPLLNIGLGLTVVQNPRLTWTTKFATFAVDGPGLPFIVQVEAEPTVKVLGEGSDFEFNNAAHQYSVEKSGNVGFGRFDRAVLTTFI